MHVFIYLCISYTYICIYVVCVSGMANDMGISTWYVMAENAFTTCLKGGFGFSSDKVPY